MIDVETIELKAGDLKFAEVFIEKVGNIYELEKDYTDQVVAPFFEYFLQDLGLECRPLTIADSCITDLTIFSFDNSGTNNIIASIEIKSNIHKGYPSPWVQNYGYYLFEVFCRQMIN